MGICGTAEVGKKDLKERETLKDLDVNGKVILEWILKKSVWRVWTGHFLCRRLTNTLVL